MHKVISSATAKKLSYNSRFKFCRFFMLFIVPLHLRGTLCIKWTPSSMQQIYSQHNAWEAIFRKLIWPYLKVTALKLFYNSLRARQINTAWILSVRTINTINHILKPNSWTFNFVEVSGHNLESSQALRFPYTMFTLQTSFKPLAGGDPLVDS
jgi:hypothetical protein